MQTTEKLHPEAIGLDKKSDLEILTILYEGQIEAAKCVSCLLYTSPSPRDATLSRMPSSA